MHILVCGGSKGIGKAIVNKYLSNGHNVSYFYNKTAPDSNSLGNAIKCDCSSFEEISNGIESAVNTYGRIDVLIYNAGISMTGVFDMFTPEDYHKIMDTNFGGLFYASKLVAPSMISNKSGSIIAVSSMWGQTGASCEALYSATKGAIDSFVKSLAKELGPSGIRVNCVSPGVINTDMMNEYSEEDKLELKEETPLQRLGTPEDVANTVYYLSSEEASFITGQILGVNGGFLI